MTTALNTPLDFVAYGGDDEFRGVVLAVTASDVPKYSRVSAAKVKPVTRNCLPVQSGCLRKRMAETEIQRRDVTASAVASAAFVKFEMALVVPSQTLLLAMIPENGQRQLPLTTG